MRRCLWRVARVFLGTAAGVGLGVFPAHVVAQDGSLTVSFGTSSAGGRYSPNHVLAVWIETANHDFVRTLSVTSESRYSRYLRAWTDSSASSDIDAVTTATLRSYETRSATWDLKNENGTVVSPGSYLLRLELCDSNADSASDNNQAEVSFEVAAEDFMKSTSDGGFSNITITFVEPPDPCVDGDGQCPLGCEASDSDCIVSTPDASVPSPDASTSGDPPGSSLTNSDAGAETPPEATPESNGTDPMVASSRDSGPALGTDQRAEEYLHSDPICTMHRGRIERPIGLLTLTVLMLSARRRRG